MEKHIKELFVFVAEPDVPADNNAAERSLRPLVVSRKISGGTRSEPGTDSKMTLASLFGTWAARDWTLYRPAASCSFPLNSELLPLGTGVPGPWRPGLRPYREADLPDGGHGQHSPSH